MERHWTPKQGEPTCVLDTLTQAFWQHRVMLYIALVVTLTFVVQLAGLPWEWV